MYFDAKIGKFMRAKHPFFITKSPDYVLSGLSLYSCNHFYLGRFIIFSLLHQMAYFPGYLYLTLKQNNIQLY